VSKSLEIEPKDRLRNLLHELGMGQRECARALNIKERQFRRMCEGSRPVPTGVLLAVEQLVVRRGSKVSAP
jgi:plasmid maintenance system antidote protein VapI